jgi:outer membrane lipoprotein-sorting protein
VDPDALRAGHALGRAETASRPPAVSGATPALLLVPLLALFVSGPAPAVADPPNPAAPADPWTVLDAARESLAAAGAQRAEFVQTFVPAGFSSGEEERGRVALALPECLRWDYDEPFPKSFLICGERVWSWNAEDRRGQRGSVDRESQPGLDLLLLPLEDLSGRYRAEVVGTEADRVTIELTPTSGLADLTELTEATLVVDTEADRLVELAYRDREGNRTRFVLSGYEAVEEAGLFEAPTWIEWEDR